MKQQIAAVSLAVMICTTNAVAGVDRTRLQTSRVAIQNVGSATATVAVTPIDLTGLKLPPSIHNLPQRSSLSLDGSTMGLQPGFSGSVIVHSDQPVIGVVQNDLANSIGGNMGRSARTLRGPVELDNKLYLPYLHNSNGFKSYIAVQNAGSVDTDVTVDYFTDLGSTHVIKQGLPAGAGWLVEPPNDSDGTAVVQSTNTDISVHVEILYSKNWTFGSSYSYSGIPDKEASVQSFQPFTCNDPLGSLTSLAMMNVSAGTADGAGLFKGDSDVGWDTQDFPGILSYHGVNVTPPVGTPWKLGLGLLSLFPKQASFAHTRNDSLDTSYATHTLPAPVPVAFKWYLPFLDNLTNIELYSDNAGPIDFRITYKYGVSELTEIFNIPAFGRKTITYPQNTEGSAIIEALSAFPTGLAIEVKDKSKPGDFGAYSAAHTASLILFIPWFTYQYPLIERTLSGSILFQIISIIAAGNAK